MMKSYCILHKECHGCDDGLMYSARFYADPVDMSTPFQLLPRYIGSCAIRIVGNNAHLTRMVFMEAEFEGKRFGYRFENWHHLDLCLRLLEIDPALETATFERHKQSCEIARTVRIVDRIRYLTRNQNKTV